MKKIFLMILFSFFICGSALAAPAPYGPGYGFNTAPDLGGVYSPQDLKQKATIEWFRSRFRTLFSRHPELSSLNPDQWAQDAYRLVQSGQVVENSMPVGAIIRDVSFTGGGWTRDRIWTAAPGYPKAPQGVWDLSMMDSKGNIVKIVVAKRCGNLQYIGFECRPPSPPSPPPEEPGIPQLEIERDKVPPMAFFYGQYSAPAQSVSRVFQPQPVAPVSDLPKPIKINMSQNQSQNQNNNQVNNNNNNNTNINNNQQPTRSIRISTFATGGEGFGFGEGSGSGESSAGASASGSGSAVSTGAGGPGGGAGGTATSTGASTSTGTTSTADGGGLGGGGGTGGSSGILIEGQW